MTDDDTAAMTAAWGDPADWWRAFDDANGEGGG